MNQYFTSFSEFRQRYPIRPGDPGALLGSGSYGKVLKVEDQVETEWVAIKISEFKGQDARSLRAEVELAQRLPRQANIARYDACYRLETDTGISDFAIMKYYPDGNLADLLRTTRLSVEQIKTITGGILLGLKHLHQNRIVHRDFKPANILISRDNQGRFIPKIADFGLSKLVSEEEIDSSDFDLSDGRGTPSYKAPEQIEGGRVSFNLDLWAFGVILYEMMTGEKPFSVNGRTGTESSLKREIEMKIVTVATPPRLAEIQDPYQTIIRRCLVRDIRQRVRREDELLDLLNERTPVAQFTTASTNDIADATDIWIEQQIDLQTDIFPAVTPNPALNPIQTHTPAVPLPASAPVLVTDAKPLVQPSVVMVSDELPKLSSAMLTQTIKPNQRQSMWYGVVAAGALTIVLGVWVSGRDAIEPKEITGKSVEITEVALPKPKSKDPKPPASVIVHRENRRPGKSVAQPAQQAVIVPVLPISKPSAKPTETKPAELLETERLAEKQTAYDALLQKGSALVQQGDKSGGIELFGQARQLADGHDLNTSKAQERYANYFQRGMTLFENDEVELAKSWFLVAQSLKNTTEVQTKIRQCSN